MGFFDAIKKMFGASGQNEASQPAPAADTAPATPAETTPTENQNKAPAESERTDGQNQF